MDLKVKAKLNKFFIKNYSKVYEYTPEVKSEGNDYFYTSSKISNIICLIPIDRI